MPQFDHRLLRPLSVATCALALASCGNSGGARQAQTVFGTAGTSTVARMAGVYEEPPEAMPQVRYIINDAKPTSVADSYVVGDFVSVEPGRSFRWTFEDEKEVTHETAFNAEDAQASSVHLVLRIKRSIVDPDLSASAKREFSAGKTVTLGLGMGRLVDIDAIRKELQGTTLVALLYKSPVFDYDKSLWGVLRDGGLLGTVSDDDRTVTFPRLEEPHDDVNPAQHIFTVEELERPSGEPVRVTRDNGRYVREGSSPSPDPVPVQPVGKAGPRDVPAATSPAPNPG